MVGLDDRRVLVLEHLHIHLPHYLLPMDVQIGCLSLLSLARGGVITLNVFNPVI